MKIKCAVHYQGERQFISLSSHDSLLKGLRKSGIPLAFSCGGEGICTTCRIFILEGQVSPRGSIEHERAQERQYKKEERLACQTYGLSPELSLKIP